MLKVHTTAIVHPDAELGEGVEIGPYSVISNHVSLADGVKLHAHVVIEPFTRVGPDTEIFPGAILGGIPQDRKFKDEKSYLIVGANNIIRECVTLHRAAGEGQETRIGDNNLLMAYSHIGHNCMIGNYITMANMVGISGHATVDDRVTIGGFVGIHQFVRIGTYSMLGGYSKVVQDVPPYMTADGRPAKVLDLNTVGLRRSGVPPSTRLDLKQAYKLLFRSNMNVTQALEVIERELPSSPEMDNLIRFMRNIRKGYGGRQQEQPRT